MLTVLSVFPFMDCSIAKFTVLFNTELTKPGTAVQLRSGLVDFVAVVFSGKWTVLIEHLSNQPGY